MRKDRHTQPPPERLWWLLKYPRPGEPRPQPYLAWCRSTPYYDSFLAFSRKWISLLLSQCPYKESINDGHGKGLGPSPAS